jgi:hypothetical protein
MTPTKEEFQQLIDACNKNRFSLPTFDIDNLAIADLASFRDSIENAFISLDNEIEKAFVEFESLSAYRWMTVTHKLQYDTAMKRLWPRHTSRHARIVLCRMLIIDVYTKAIFAYKHSKEALRQSGIYSLRQIVTDGFDHQMRRTMLFYVEKMQEKERMIGHIASCFMDYLYPDPKKRMEPVEFYDAIDNTIGALAKVIKEKNKLSKYSDILFNKDLSTGTEILSQELDELKAIKANELFPVQRVNDHYQVRMFIVAVVRKFLGDRPICGRICLPTARSRGKRPGYPIKDVLEFVMALLGFSCFGDGAPMTAVNVRKAICEEIERSNRMK